MERTKIHEEVLMCCNYRRCPKVTVFDDGSVQISDDDSEIGSVGTIKIRPEAADRLLELLSNRKK